MPYIKGLYFCQGKNRLQENDPLIGGQVIQFEKKENPLQKKQVSEEEKEKLKKKKPNISKLRHYKEEFLRKYDICKK